MANPRTNSYIALSSGLLVAYNVFVPTAALAAPPESDAEVEITAPANPSAPVTVTQPTAGASATATVQPAAPGTSAIAPAPTAVASTPVAAKETDKTGIAAAANTVKAEPVQASADVAPKGEKAVTVDLGKFDVSGYVQSQLEFHQDSSDQLRQGGALLNQNRFLIRRGRIRVSRDWEFASVILEFDGNTSKGPSARLQKGEASLVYGRSKEKGMPPLLQFTVGLFDLPFGYELVEAPKMRWFMERSIISRALFPGEPDVGMRLSGAAGFLRYSVALTNGEPLDEKSGYALQDPNANKDVTVRMGADTSVSSAFRVSGGVSYNVGKGFRPGKDANKGVVNASDPNGDGLLTINDITLTPATAAVPSQNFERWAMAADLQLRFKSGLGQTMLYGEVVAAQNLDRGLVIADPVLSNVREFGGFVGLTQEITKYGIVGLRGDYYDPNSDFLDNRAGKQVPTDLRVYGLSPMAGFALPDRARLLLQWDIQDNKFARDARGVPTRLKNNAVTLRLQVNL